MEPGEIVHSFKSKNGKSVLIRALCETDVDDSLAYINALIAEDTYIYLSGEPLTKFEEETFIRDSIQKMKDVKKVILVVEMEGKFCGICNIDRQERRKRHVGLVGITLAPSVRDQGIGMVCMETLIEQGRKMGLKLLYLHVFANNPRAIHLYEKVGFKNAGMVPGMLLFRGEYCGEITMYKSLDM